MFTIYSLPTGSVQETLSRAWTLAGRTIDLPWERAESAVRNGIRESEGMIGLDMRHLRRGFGAESKPFTDKPEISFANGFERCTWAVHQLAREGGINNLWGGTMEKPWSELVSDSRYNYTLLFLAGNFAHNLNVLSSKQVNDLELPKRQPADIPSHLECGYTVGCKEEGTLEWAVRYEIEYAWRNRQVPIRWEDSLDWSRVTVAALDAIYSTIGSLDEADNYNAVNQMCERLHEHMTHYGMWEDDTEAYRVHPDGKRKYFTGIVQRDPDTFGRLDPIRQRENYVLIIFSALSAISDHKIEKVPVEQRFGKQVKKSA